METHIREDHANLTVFQADNVLHSLLDTFEHVTTSPQPCLLCSNGNERRKFSAPKNLQRHLASHMRQVALWVVRNRCDESDVELEVEKLEEDQLVAAVMQGNLKVVEKLLVGGAEVNTKNSDGDAVLSLAAYEGHNAILRTLLEMAPMSI